MYFPPLYRSPKYPKNLFALNISFLSQRYYVKEIPFIHTNELEEIYRNYLRNFLIVFSVFDVIRVMRKGISN